MSKCKAYSLVEITVVLLITGLIVSIGYTGFSYFNRSFLGFRIKSDAITERSLFYHAIKADMTSCNYAIEKGNSIQFVYPTGETSFRFTASEIIYSKNNREIKVFDVPGSFTTESLQVPNLVNVIHVEFKKKNQQSKKMTLFKEYDPQLILYLE